MQQKRKKKRKHNSTRPEHVQWVPNISLPVGYKYSNGQSFYSSLNKLPILLPATDINKLSSNPQTVRTA